MMLDIDIAAGLGETLAEIARERGAGISPGELAEAARLCEECRRADAGEVPGAGSTDGLLPVAVPVGCLVVRSVTIRARLKLMEAQHWPLPAGTAEDQAEYSALLVAWILAHGRDGDELALLTAESAAAIVQDLRGRMGCTLDELQAALGAVVKARHEEASLMERWADADQVPRPVDWAQILLALASEGGCSIEAAMDLPEGTVAALFAGLRRRRAEMTAKMTEVNRHAPPDPDSAKARAYFAWQNFERALRGRRGTEGGAAA